MRPITEKNQFYHIQIRPIDSAYTDRWSKAFVVWLNKDLQSLACVPLSVYMIENRTANSTNCL